VTLSRWPQAGLSGPRPSFRTTKAALLLSQSEQQTKSEPSDTQPSRGKKKRHHSSAPCTPCSRAGCLRCTHAPLQPADTPCTSLREWAGPRIGSADGSDNVGSATGRLAWEQVPEAHAMPVDVEGRRPDGTSGGRACATGREHPASLAKGAPLQRGRVKTANTHTQSSHVRVGGKASKPESGDREERERVKRWDGDADSAHVLSASVQMRER